MYDQAHERAVQTMSNDVERYDEMPTPAVLRKDYRFLRLLGEGANGKTYLAIARVSQAFVAIKALKLVDQFKSLDLFIREAQTLSDVHVQGVPKFLGFISSDNELNEYYIIQEYIEYPSLQQWIERYLAEGRTIPESVVLQIMSKLSDILFALQTDYSPPIIHRDIKPSNILYDDQTGQVMLIDFGAVANPAKKSGGSTVAGTQGFMAPEQLMGECTIQSDFYGVGATMLYMLTGVSPVNMEFDAANPFLLRCDEHLKRHQISQPTQELIYDLISPQIEKRPENAFVLKSRIQNIILGKTVDSKAHSHLISQLKNRRTQKRVLAVSSITLLLGIVLFVFLGFDTILTFLSPIDVRINPVTGKDVVTVKSILQTGIIVFLWWCVICVGLAFSYYVLPKIALYINSSSEPKLDFGCGDKLYKVRCVARGDASVPGSRDCFECVYYDEGKYYYYYDHVVHGQQCPVYGKVRKVHRTVQDIDP